MPLWFHRESLSGSSAIHFHRSHCSQHTLAINDPGIPQGWRSTSWERPDLSATFLTYFLTTPQCPAGCCCVLLPVRVTPRALTCPGPDCSTPFDLLSIPQPPETPTHQGPPIILTSIGFSNHLVLMNVPKSPLVRDMCDCAGSCPGRVKRPGEGPGHCLCIPSCPRYPVIWCE